MPRILVTGGAGFFGHHLVEHILKTTNWEIVVLDNLTYASNGFDRLRDIEAFDDRRVTRFVWDISNPMETYLMREIGPIHYIAHCAAQTHVDKSITNPWPFIESNIIGTARILDYACTLAPNLSRMLYFSTDEVFGPASVHPSSLCSPNHFPSIAHAYGEWDRYNSTNPYAATKAAGEELCLAWANTYRIQVTIVHCMNLFGERQHPEKFIPNTIARILRGETVIIHADPACERPGSRTYIHARNAADAALFVLRHGRQRDKYNIVGQQEVDNLALARMIASELDRPLSFELVDFHSSRPGHDLRYGLTSSKLAVLGWTPPMAFEATLRKTIRWYLDHPKWLAL